MRRFIILVLLLIFFSNSFSRIVYVKVPSSGLNNGTGWLNAYTSLTSALNLALAGDTIKVATGTYKPGPVSTSFFSMKNNVVLLGGYATDTTITTRDWKLYKVILSGEIGNSQMGDNIETIISGININSSAIWDGFIVEASYKNSLALTGNSQPVFRNIIFRNSTTASYAGVAINCRNSSPKFLNCIFYNNTGYFCKGIIYSYENSNLEFTNCVFAKNQIWDTASVFFTSQSTLTITNSTFFGNTTISDEGRAVINCTNNSALNIRNSIFFYNLNRVDAYNDYAVQDSSEIYLKSGSIASASNSILQNYTNGISIYSGQNPRFRDTSDIDGPDNIFFTADDGLQLINPCSPAMNSGNNAFTSDITTDILGNPRIFNSQVVDLGAYEVQAAPAVALRVVYVKKTASGLNDGSSWINAFTDLQRALLYCADTVKVAADIYYPSLIQNPHIAFNLQNKMILLGGYPNTGNPTDSERNPQVYNTTLSGNLSVDAKSFSVLQSKRNDSTSIVDGFEIREGGVVNEFGIRRSASIYITSSSPVFKNIKIKKNQEAPAILSIIGSSPRFFDCKIDSNAIGAEISFSSPLFKRCSFTANQAGVISNLSSATTIDSCLFIRNPSTMILNTNNSNGIISNSRFINNGNMDSGPDIYNVSSSPVVSNCYFSDSLTAQYGGAIRNENPCTPVFKFCEFRNYKVIYSGAVVHSSNSNPVFISCIFADNTASGVGGVAHNINYSRPKFINCVASYNKAGSGSFVLNDRSFPEIINTTASKNSSYQGVTNGASVIYNRDSSDALIKNSIFWGNTLLAQDFDSQSGAPNVPSKFSVFNSVTQSFGTNGVNGNLVGIDPRMIEYNDPDGLDNIYYTSDDGNRLAPCSPALNTGNNSAVTESIDVLSNTRIIGSTVDMGAFEYQLPPGGVSNVCFVNSLATGNNTGTSWANAYTSLWSAINNICVDTIKVAAGTYKPAVYSRDSSFLLVHGKVYLGGYPNTGNPSNVDRNPILYPVILDGNIGNPADSTDNTRQVVNISYLDGEIIFDGFTIIHGQTEQYAAPQNLITFFSGGALLNVSSKTTIVNCIIKNNYATKGGGIAVFNSPKLRISNTLIQKNRADGYGGGLYIVTGITPKAIVENSVITDNFCTGIGGGVYVAPNSSFFAEGIDFNNVIMHNNNGDAGGGGMYIQSPYKVSITNCHFVNNICSPIVRGAGLYNKYDNSSMPVYPIVKNSIFKGNAFDAAGTGENFLGLDIFDSNCPGYNCFRNNINQTRVQTYLYGGNFYSDPQFLNSADPDGADNIWMTADDGLSLLPCSPLNNIGDNASVTQIPSDITGRPRIINSRVDLGAYESNIASVSITVVDTLVCMGVPVIFTAAPVNGGTTPVYQWQVNGINSGTNSSTFITSSLNNNDQVKVIMKSSETCLAATNVSSNIITVHTVSSVPVSVTISTSQNSICAGASINFVASPVNGGTTPSYQWQVNGINSGTNNNSFTTSSLNNNDQVKAIMTSNYTCASPATATSNIIAVTVTPVVSPSVIISASSTSVCAGANVTFTAIPTNGGTTPSFQWKNNGLNVGSNSTTYSNSNLVNGDIISVAMTSNALCLSSATANSNTITMTVNNIVAPSITINGNSVVTAGAASSITTAIVSGGSNPSYQWQDSTNGHGWQNIAGATNTQLNYTPLLTGDKLRCLLTSNATCILSTAAISNALSFTVNAVTAISPVPASSFGIIYYPNPSTSILIIDSMKLSDRWQSVNIASIDGKQNIISRSLNNETRISIDVSSLPAGQYAAILRRKNNSAVYLIFIKL